MSNPKIKFDKNVVRKLECELIESSKEIKHEGNISGTIRLKNSTDTKNFNLRSTAIVDLKLTLKENKAFKFYIQLDSFFKIISDEVEFKLTRREIELIANHMSQKSSNILSNNFELATNRPLIYDLKNQFLKLIKDKEE